MATKPAKLKQLPTDPSFWEAEREALYILLFPYMQEAIQIAAMNAFSELAASVDLGIAWDFINPNVIAWAQQYTERVVSQISKTSMAAFLDHFEPWVQSGDPLKSLISALEPFYGPIRAEMVAVTETTRAYAMGNIATWNATGMVEGFDVMTGMDDLVCPICTEQRSLNPHAMTDDPPPYHVNCLPGDSLVLPIGGVSAGSKRWYEGNIITIETLVNKLTVTPNHPILTPSGWIPASRLQEGEYVWGYIPSEWEIGSVQVNDQNRVTTIEDVFSSLEFVSLRVPTSPPDFHGDGANSEVAVIRTNGKVVDNSQSTFPQPISELDFLSRNIVFQAALPRFSPSASFVEGHASSFGGFMRSLNLSFSLPCGHPAPFDKFRFRLPTRSYAGFEQPFSKSSPADAQLVSKDILRLAGKVALQKIVKVGNMDFSGHVYNLQTDSGIYVAGGIITHNCRCYLQPVVNL